MSLYTNIYLYSVLMANSCNFRIMPLKSLTLIYNTLAPIHFIVPLLLPPGKWDDLVEGALCPYSSQQFQTAEWNFHKAISWHLSNCLSHILYFPASTQQMFQSFLWFTFKMWVCRKMYVLITDAFPMSLLN